MNIYHDIQIKNNDDYEAWVAVQRGCEEFFKNINFEDYRNGKYVDVYGCDVVDDTMEKFKIVTRKVKRYLQKKVKEAKKEEEAIQRLQKKQRARQVELQRLQNVSLHWGWQVGWLGGETTEVKQEKVREKERLRKQQQLQNEWDSLAALREKKSGKGVMSGYKPKRKKKK